MKRTMSKVLTGLLVGTGLLTIALGTHAQAQKRNISVGRSAICLDVRDREPVDADTTFNADVGFLCCFTRVEGATDSTSVTHVWYYGQSKVAEITLPVKSARWRTYSRKKILPNWTGKWNVVVLSEGGDPLAQLSFLIKEPQTE